MNNLEHERALRIAHAPDGIVPKLEKLSAVFKTDGDCGRWYSLSPFQLPKADDWTESLYQIKKGKLIKCQEKKSK